MGLEKVLSWCAKCGIKQMAKRGYDTKADGTVVFWRTDWYCSACEDLRNANYKFEAACGFLNKALKKYEKRGLSTEEIKTILANSRLFKLLTK